MHFVVLFYLLGWLLSGAKESHFAPVCICKELQTGDKISLKK